MLFASSVAFFVTLAAASPYFALPPQTYDRHVQQHFPRRASGPNYLSEGCGDLPAPSSSAACSARYELRGPSASAVFNGYPPATMVVDNGNAYSVYLSIVCGAAAHEVRARAFSCCGFPLRGGPVPCTVSTKNKGWVGVWACVDEGIGAKSGIGGRGHHGGVYGDGGGAEMREAWNHVAPLTWA